MKKRIAALLLALLLVSGGMAQAASLPTGEPYDGRFTDVHPDDWFYPNVSTLYSLGLTRGKTADLFGVYDNISIKEVVGFAARLRSLLFYGEAEYGPSSYVPAGLDEEHWYLPYVLYLQSEGALDAEFLNRLDQPATRAQTARIAVAALPSELFTSINDAAVSVGYATRTFIPDVTDYTPYQQEILQLYRWGIVTGSDAQGRFYPDTPITRGEFSALLTRLADPSLRVKLDWDISAYYTAKSKTYASLVPPGAYRRTHALDDYAAIDENIRYMLSGGANTLTVQLSREGVTEAMVSQLMGAYLNAVRTYIEQGYNAVSCSYSGSTGRVTLRFYSSLFPDAAFATARSDTLTEAIRIHDQLWSEGTITASMTQWEKARIYYTYICNHSTYDYQAVDSSLSHSAYSLFFLGTAVCDGYTAAYNLLLKLEGIPCTTYSTDSHIWTIADLDGVRVHIDPTWGDQGAAIRYEYFGMTEAQSLGRF